MIIYFLMCMSCNVCPTRGNLNPNPFLVGILSISPCLPFCCPLLLSCNGHLCSLWCA
eukprot:jgi/Botrbrau1/3297/Bobra.174_1s0060.1